MLIYYNSSNKHFEIEWTLVTLPWNKDLDKYNKHYHFYQFTI